MRNLLRTLSILLAVPIAACNYYENITGRFVLANTSQRHTVEFVVEGGGLGPVMTPGSHTNGNNPITVPLPKYSQTAGSTDPRTVAEVSIQAHILDMNKLTDWVSCEAGEGLVTHVEFSVYNEDTFYESYQVQCWTSYPGSYDVIPGSLRTIRGQMYKLL